MHWHDYLLFNYAKPPVQVGTVIPDRVANTDWVCIYFSPGVAVFATYVRHLYEAKTCRVLEGQEHWESDSLMKAFLEYVGFYQGSDKARRSNGG